MKKFLLVIICALCSMGFTFPAPESSHELYKNNLGLVTEDSLNIYSGLIGSSILRDKIMNSPEWFYKGKFSGSESEIINAVKQELLKSNPNLSQRELDRTAREIFRENISPSGQARIAKGLMQYAPFLSKAEAMKAAEQNYASMLAKKVPDLLDKAADNIKDLLESPDPEALKAHNKLAVNKALKTGNFDSRTFTGQEANFSRLKAQYYSDRYKLYNPAGRNDVGITIDGRTYLFRMNSRNLAETLRKNPNARIILPDDQYEKFINNAKFDESARTRVVSEGSITGNHDSLELQREKLSAMTEDIQDLINQSEQQRNYSLRQKIFSSMKKAAPYAAFGTFKSLSENWELLNDAYNSRESFSKALTRTGADFAGYTVTPMLIDGVLTLAGKKAALAMSLKNAGMGYTLGVSLWEAGREYFAYSLGEIPSEEFYNRAGRIAARTVEEIVSVNVIGYLVSCTGYTMLVPVVIFAGQNIIQRSHSWYEDKQKEKQWLNSVYLDDITKILGEDLINTFTIINPETRPSIANPETRYNLANPFTRPSLARP